MADTHNVAVALTEYPDSLDNSLGNALAGVLSDVATAHAQRIARGCDAAHDDALPPGGVEFLILEHLSEAARAPDPTYRERMVEVAALAVAAVASCDRLTGEAVHG